MAGSTLMRKRTMARQSNSMKSKIARLERKVQANTPELQQQSYTITIAPGQDIPPALVDPGLVTGDEIKLHRIHVAWEQQSDDVPEGSAWGILYSPKQGYNLTDLPNGTAPFDSQNYLQLLDQTRQRVWSRMQWDQSLFGSPGGGNRFCCMDKKFSIPMTIGTRGEVDPTVSQVVHNQIFYIGSNRDTDSPQDLEVTIFFTDA